MQGLETLDWVVIAAYFLLIAALAIWVMSQKQNNTEEYFLAGRNLGWFIIGASIFASNIGSEHLVGLAGSGATDGVALAHYELHAWCLLVLGWIMVPFYMRSKVFTMPEFLEKRYSPQARTILSVISLVAYVLTKIAVGMFAGGIVFSVLLPDVEFLGMTPFWFGSILVIILTGIYSIIGGFKAVAYTEALQTVILVIGSLLLTIYGLDALGGWDRLREIAGPECSISGNQWCLLEWKVRGSCEGRRQDGMVLQRQLPVAGHAVLCTYNRTLVLVHGSIHRARTLGASNETQARRGSIFAAFLKLLPVFIFIIPGLITYALAKSGTNPAMQQVLFDEMECLFARTLRGISKLV